jgi:hypothetical protein
VTPFAPIHLPAGFCEKVDCLRKTSWVVVERLALAAVLAELPCVAFAVAVLVACIDTCAVSI